jgi:hypothetical protein
MADESHEVRAIDRRVVEPGALAIPVSVEAAAADLKDMAGPALRGQRVRSQLPGHHARQRQSLVEPIAGYVKMCRCGAVIGHLEAVGQLDRAVSLDNHGCRGRKAKHFSRRITAEQQLHDLVEQPDWRARTGIPVVEHGDQPVGVGSVRCARHPAGRGHRPCSVGQQEVDPRRIPFAEGLVGGDRLIAKVDGAQEPAEKMPEVRLYQPVQAGGHGAMTSSSAGEPAMAVVCFRRAIKADSYLYAKLAEQPQIGIVQADGIRLHLGVHLDARAGHGPSGAYEFADELMSGQQWFAAVHNQRHARYPVQAGMLADARRRVMRNLH